VQVPLREGDLDPCRVQRVVDGEQQVALGRQVVVELFSPCPELEVERAFAESGEDRPRLRRGQHLRMVLGAPGGQLDHLVRVGSVRDPDRDFHAALPVRQGPVGDLVGDQVRVGNDDLGAAPGADRARAHPDSPDLAPDVSHLHRVARLDGALERQDQARDEVVHHVLQAEADADRQGAGDQGEFRQVDAGRRYGQDEREPQDRVVEKHDDGGRHAPGQGDPGEDFHVQDEAKETGHVEAAKDGEHETDDVAQGDAYGTDGGARREYGPEALQDGFLDPEIAQRAQEPKNHGAKGRYPDDPVEDDLPVPARHVGDLHHGAEQDRGAHAFRDRHGHEHQEPEERAEQGAFGEEVCQADKTDDVERG